MGVYDENQENDTDNEMEKEKKRKGKKDFGKDILVTACGILQEEEGQKNQGKKK